MSILELVAAIQTSDLQSQASHPVAAWYFLIALIAAVVGLVVTIFIRSSAGRSPKQ